MALREFKPGTLQIGSRPLERIGITFLKTGVIVFSKRATESFGLSAGTRFLLLQDEKEKDEWYVSFHVSDGYSLYCKGNTVNINHRQLCSQVWDSLGIKTPTTLNIAIGEKPAGVHNGHTYYQLITATAQRTGRS
jgi:hypothetical protein